jgi:undecaprenyl-diphosphatase
VAAPPNRAEVIGRRVGIPATLAIVGLVALGTAAGWVVVHGFGGAVDRFDHRVARALADGRTPLQTSITGAAVVLANTPTVLAGWAAAMAVTWWRTRAWRLPLFFLTAIGGEKLTYLLTGMIVGRPRPPVPPLGEVFATHSFPSGHVGSAIVLYGGIVVALRWRSLGARLAGAAAVALAAGLVGWSRMYRGHHYLSDVVWGTGLGVVWLTLAWRLVLRDGPDELDP